MKMKSNKRKLCRRNPAHLRKIVHDEMGLQPSSDPAVVFIINIPARYNKARSERVHRVCSSWRGFRGEIARSDLYLRQAWRTEQRDLRREPCDGRRRGVCDNVLHRHGGDLGCLRNSCRHAGAKLLRTKCLYGCTYSLFKNWYPRYKIKVTWVDFNDFNALSRAITPQTRMLYFETPVNPTMELIDIQKVVEITKQHNVHRSQAHRIFSVVDNTFATPFCQRPISARC